MLAMQLKTVRVNQEKTTTRTSEVQAQYAELKKNYDAKILELEEKDRILEEYRKAETDEETVELLKLELVKSQQDAGLTNVRGTGLTILMEDSLADFGSGIDLNNYLVHDEDILKVVNELKSAGAEAISVNDQRIISMSEIRCAGTTIFINGERIGAPFTIKAIGDPAVLESAMTMRGGNVDILKEWGIRFTITRESDIVVPKYNKSVSSKYITTVTEDTTNNIVSVITQ
jgi:uncharacterized protein YlxW (UPF0749 family)